MGFEKASSLTFTVWGCAENKLSFSCLPCVLRHSIRGVGVRRARERSDHSGQRCSNYGSSALSNTHQQSPVKHPPANIFLELFMQIGMLGSIWVQYSATTCPTNSCKDLLYKSIRSVTTFKDLHKSVFFLFHLYHQVLHLLFRTFSHILSHDKAKKNILKVSLLHRCPFQDACN